MDFLSVISKHWFEFVVAIYFISMIFQGYRKGFIRLVVSATALLITIVAVKYMQPYVVDWLKQETKVYETVKEQITDKLGLDMLFDDSEMTHSIQKEDEWMIIDGLSIPDQIKEFLTKNNNTEVYKMMGVEYFRDYVGEYLAKILIQTVVFVILFVVVYLILQIIMLWLDLIAKLPIISGINKIAGAALGGVQAAVFIWIMFLAITLFSESEIGAMLLSQISSSVWLSWIYEHNIIVYFVLGIIRTAVF